MKVMVDNFGVLGIESCILDGLSDTFSPDMVMRLDDSLIRNIAIETEESQMERARTIKKLKSLQAGLQTLNCLNRNKPAGWWMSFIHAPFDSANTSRELMFFQQTNLTKLSTAPKWTLK